MEGFKGVLGGGGFWGGVLGGIFPTLSLGLGLPPNMSVPLQKVSYGLEDHELPACNADLNSRELSAWNASLNPKGKLLRES